MEVSGGSGEIFGGSWEPSEAHGNCLKAHGNRPALPRVSFNPSFWFWHTSGPFISLIHYCFPFRQYGGAWKSWKYYTMKFSKRRVGGNRCLHPLFKSLSSWASLYRAPCGCPFVRLTEAAGPLDDSVDLPAARRAYLTRDSEPKPGEDFISLCIF